MAERLFSLRAIDPICNRDLKLPATNRGYLRAMSFWPREAAGRFPR
jgi:hypothetical protein